jgi:valyl-tRNA synthetase
MINASAPYNQLLTHGFVGRSNGRKMSKSSVAPRAAVGGILAGRRIFCASPQATDYLRRACVSLARNFKRVTEIVSSHSQHGALFCSPTQRF